jgi:hypothetical protein
MIFFYLSAFAAAAVQFLASVQVLRGIKKLFPLGISLLLTLGMRYLVQNLILGSGSFPFPTGTGLYIFFIMCTIGIVVGLISWFCWYIVFHKFIQTRRGFILSRLLFIVIQFVATISLYWMAFYVDL